MTSVKNPRKLPATQCYLASKRQLKEHLGDIDDAEIILGETTGYNFDSNVKKRPVLKGAVVMSTTVSRDNTVHAQLYPVREEDLHRQAKDDFVPQQLAQVRDWILQERRVPEESKLGIRQQLIIYNGVSFDTEVVDYR